jgi:metal-dependent amidase/aminoacylase/carboxypeptidase family protein
LATRWARRDGLDLEISFADRFPATINTESAVATIRRAAGDAQVTDLAQPFRWSEDFGHFTAAFGGALFGLGAGLDTPDLHNPDYDFPDGLIEPGVKVFLNLVDEILGRDAA